MSSSHLDEEADHSEELDHKHQPPSDDRDSDTGSEYDGDDPAGHGIDEDPQARRAAKLQDIFDKIKPATDSEIIIDGLNLQNPADLSKFVEVNSAYLDQETTQKKRNLLHLIADEMSEPRFSRKMRKLRLLIIELAKLPANLLERKDANGSTPIHYALHWGNAKLVRYVCEAREEANSFLKIPVEKSGQQSGNCLHLAMKNSDKFKEDDRTKLLDTLIKKSKPDTLCAADAQGFTPLHLAVDAFKCDDAQLAIVKALVDQCDKALDIMCKYGGKDCVSPYRYHVLTQEVLHKQRAETKPNRAPSKEDAEAIKSSEKSAPKVVKKIEPPSHMSKLQPILPEARSQTLSKSRQTGPMPLVRQPTLELSTKVEAVIDNTTPPLTPDMDKKKPIKKSSKPTKAEPTEAGMSAVRQYLKEYCLRTRDHDEAVDLLYGPRQDKQIYFDLNGASHNWTKNGFVEGLRHLELEDVLQYVAIPQLHVEEEIPVSRRKPSQRPPRPDGKGRTDLETLFKWLKDEKRVNTTFKIIVDDLQEPSHRDEVIESCLEGIKGVETWDWRKFDISPEVIQKAAPHVKVVHLYWSGNNAILRAWSEERGIRRLKNLKTVHLHSMQGLESRSRMQRYIKDFKSDVETKRSTDPQIEVEHRDMPTEGSENAGNGIDVVKNIYERHKWVTTMEEFAEFLVNAEKGADLPPELPHPVKVALIDDGVDSNDSVIHSRIVYGRSFCRRDRAQQLNHAYYVSGGGHGTAMASLVCKICPNAQLYVLRLDEKASIEPGRRNITAESAEKAVTAAIEKGVDIICMSWTINKGRDNEASIEKLENALARAAQMNILMFCAAADQGPVKDNSYPAATTRTKNIFKIGAAEASGEAMTWLGDPDLVDFIFPGHQVIKERTDDPSVRKFTALTGSSVSTALAAGLAALILYCVQIAAIVSNESESGPDLSKYQSLKNHQSMKKAFLGIGTTETSKSKYLRVWDKFDKPVRDSEGQLKDQWIKNLTDLANTLIWHSLSR